MAEIVDRLGECGVWVGTGQRPDACTINVYEEGMWLPPHVDSDKFMRPFFTLSLVSEQESVFGEIIDGHEGEWTSGARIKMPVGSVLRVDGYAGGPKCLHAVSRTRDSRRISLTFRKLASCTTALFEQQREEAAQCRQEKISRKKKKRDEKKRIKNEKKACIPLTFIFYEFKFYLRDCRVQNLNRLRDD